MSQILPKFGDVDLITAGRSLSPYTFMFDEHEARDAVHYQSFPQPYKFEKIVVKIPLYERSSSAQSSLASPLRCKEV